MDSRRRHGLQQYWSRRIAPQPAAGCGFGFQPDAPADKLYIDPALPDWLEQLTVRDLRVGKRIFDLRFWRDGKATRFEVLKGDATVIHQSSYATGMDRWV